MSQPDERDAVRALGEVVEQVERLGTNLAQGMSAAYVHGLRHALRIVETARAAGDTYQSMEAHLRDLIAAAEDPTPPPRR